MKKKLVSWTINWEEYRKAIKIEEIAEYFIRLTKIDENTYEGGIFDWDPKVCNEKRLFIFINTQTFKYGDLEGDIADFINFMCPHSETTYFLRKLKGIERERYAKRFKYSDGSIINVKKYPIKNIKKYMRESEL